MEQLIQLYESWAGAKLDKISRIAGAGSNRQYYRLADKKGNSVIGAIGVSREENHAFIYLSRHFNDKQLPVPQILAVSEDKLRYIQTDLGSTALFDSISGGREAGGRYNNKERQLLVNTVRALPAMQIIGAQGLDWSNCYPQQEFGKDSVFFDLNYFKYCFLKVVLPEFNELKLEADFNILAKDLTSERFESFMYRDFQARNIMLDTRNNPYFIDYQGGRKGPFYYDIASFLWQASARYSFKLRRELVFEYYDSLKNYIEVPSVRHFAERLSVFVLFRILQVLGAYGFRGYLEHKQHFLDSIPPAIDNLRDLIKLKDVFPYPYLMSLLKKITELPQFSNAENVITSRTDGFKTTDNTVYKANPNDGPATYSKYDDKGKLVIRVYSFSYHKGIPPDNSGNGGGYVFDCRATHNPGRYEPYKKLTGLDESVIRFLEDDGEILTFLDSVYMLANKHVERYIQRGFTSLMFAFGCTGGQHRSVYCAQHLAEHLHEKYGIEVRIVHREQDINQTLEAKR